MAEPTIPDNVPTSPDNVPTEVPTNPDKVPNEVPTNPDKVPDKVPDQVPNEVPDQVPNTPQERPKTRGRPWGSKDAKPRIRRVPVVVAQEEEEEPAAAPAATKKVQIAEPAQHIPEPPRKSPRTLHREHVQALAAERRALAQAKQAHYESMFDRNLSW